MLTCLEVVLTLNSPVITTEKKITDKCMKVGEIVFYIVKRRAKAMKNDIFNHLLFTQTFWDNLRNKLKVIMTETHRKESSYLHLKP